MLSPKTRIALKFSQLSLAITAGASFVATSRPVFAVVAAMAMLAFQLGFSGVGRVVGADTGAGTNESLTTLAGDLKVVYGTKLVEVLPDSAIMQKRHPLADSADYPFVGEYFSALIAVQLPWGLSFLGNGTEGTATNYTLGDALAGQTKPAKIYPATQVMVDNLQYQILDRAAKAGTQAVLSAMTLTGKQMAINSRNVLELQLLHGQEGLGAASGAISTLTVTFDAATTSPGILSILKGARVQFFQSNLTTARTAHDNSNYLTVASVNLSNLAAPTLTLTATGTTGVANIVTGDVMYIGGSRGVSVAAGATSVPFYEQIGLGKQLSATSGSQFDISKTDFQGWVANQISSIGAFTPSALMQAASLSLARGGMLGDYEAIVSPRAWGVLSSALATNEIYDKPNDFTMAKKTGTDEIIVRNAGITMTVIPHPFQKDGQFYVLPSNELKRIGSIDLTFSIPGKKGDDEFFFPLEGQAVMQRQARADWQCVLLSPPSGCIGTGISY
jgi:hypothetical protein